jgi:acetyl esterase/lipase
MKNEVADKIETNRPFLGKYALFLALAASVAATQDGNALQAGSIDSGGTVHVPAMLLPYSRLASEQARARFVEKAREQLPTSNNIDDLRRFYGALNARLAVRMREVFAVSEVHETWNGIEVLRVRPQSGVTADRVLLNLHGGAFMWGGGDGEDVEAIPIAATSRIEVISLIYRLAPEHP